MRHLLPLSLAVLSLPAAFAQSPQGGTAPAPSDVASSQTTPPKPAAPPTITSIKVKDAGVFTASEEASRKPAADGIAFSAVKNVRLTKKTTTIPLSKGVNFGFQYVAVGKPLGERATLHFVEIYPAPGVTKPGASGPIARDEYDEKVRIGVKGSYDGYVIENDWEMLPGDWTLEIWNGSNKLASQTFTLVKQ